MQLYVQRKLRQREKELRKQRRIVEKRKKEFKEALEEDKRRRDQQWQTTMEMVSRWREVKKITEVEETELRRLRKLLATGEVGTTKEEADMPAQLEMKMKQGPTDFRTRLNFTDNGFAYLKEPKRATKKRLKPKPAKVVSSINRMKEAEERRRRSMGDLSLSRRSYTKVFLESQTPLKEEWTTGDASWLQQTSSSTASEDDSSKKRLSTHSFLKDGNSSKMYWTSRPQNPTREYIREENILNMERRKLIDRYTSLSLQELKQLCQTASNSFGTVRSLLRLLGLK